MSRTVRVRRLLYAALGSAMVLGLPGCGSVGMDGSLNAAQIRFVQVSPGGPDLDFYVNGTGAAYGLGFATFTSYLPTMPGQASLSVVKAGGGQPVVQAQGALAGGHQYTAVVSHGLGNLQEHVYPDQDTPAQPGQIALRVLNEVEGTAALTMYVVPTGSGATAPAAVFSLGSGTASSYFSAPANGSYAVTATIPEGALNVPVGSVNVKATSGAVRTLVFAGTTQGGGSHGVVGFALEDTNAP